MEHDSQKKTILELKEEEEIDRIAQFHADNFKQLSDIESLIIRGHILVEHELSQAISTTILCADEYKPEKFTFSQKFIIANMLGVTVPYKEEIRALNKLRNQIAHSLTHEENLINIIIEEIRKKDAKTLEGSDRVKQLATSISFICGGIAVSSKYARKIFALQIEQQELKNKLNNLQKNNS